MTEQPTGWPNTKLCTGLYWENTRPTLAASDPTGRQHRLAVALGTGLAVRISGKRACIGVWLASEDRRRPCPFTEPIAPHATDAQCPACAQADPGRGLARDAAGSPARDNGRDWVLYLVWFGPGLLKVGLTAVDRGIDRLLEQGALAFTWLARGDFGPIRRAEQAISEAGLAPERRSRRTKHAAWRPLPPPDERRRQVEDAQAQTAEVLARLAGVDVLPCQVHDQVARFGLDQLPTRAQHVRELTPEAAIAGTVLCIIGKDLILATNPNPSPDPTGDPSRSSGAGAVLLDTRLLAGWLLAPTSPSTNPSTTGSAAVELSTSTSLVLSLDTVSWSDHADHDTLF